MSTIRINFAEPSPGEKELNQNLYARLSQILAEVDIETETYSILLLSANLRKPWLELDIGRIAAEFLKETLTKIARKSSELGIAIDQYQNSLNEWNGVHATILLDNFEHRLFLSDSSDHARFFRGVGNFPYFLNAWKPLLPFLKEQSFVRIDWHLVDNDWLPVDAVIRGDGYVDPKAYWHHLNGVRNVALAYRDTELTQQKQAHCTAVLLVAVVTERRALLEELKSQGIQPTVHEIGGRYIDSFTLARHENQNWTVIIGQSTEKGPHAVQALVQDLVHRLSPQIMILVGMCGGLPEHGATDNSVVVARQVSNYEPARYREGRPPWSPTTYRASARITDLANSIAARNILPDIQILTNKDYGSGEKLIDDLNSELRRNLLNFSGDLVGFEMEGHGMLHGLWEIQRSNGSIQAAMIKGVSDFGDGKMQHNKEERQLSATRRAVRLVLEILRSY